jgi:predicted transcriptional regulator
MLGYAATGNAEQEPRSVSDDPAGTDFMELTAGIVAAYVRHNPISAAEIPGLINQVHAALATVSSGRRAPAAEDLRPMVPVKRSVTPDYIICLEDGKRFKSLKRHLRTQYNLSPDQYREKWGLPRDYPMVAPSYAATRSRLAMQIGLGQRRRRRSK